MDEGMCYNGNIDAQVLMNNRRQRCKERTEVGVHALFAEKMAFFASYRAARFVETQRAGIVFTHGFMAESLL